MQKQAKDLKVGDKILMAGEELIITFLEISDLGKQGTKKCRIEAKKKDGEKVAIIRPADYPFNCC